MKRWWARVLEWRRQRALARRVIPDALWAATLEQFPFLNLGRPADSLRLRELCSLFLDCKEFSGAHGLQVSDDMAVAVAAQACLPILHLGLSAYDGFVGIVLHDDELSTRRQHIDEQGVVHEFDDVFSGEAMAGGPVTLSWADVQAAGVQGDQAYSVVIHEMAHVLDMRDGLADGVPSSFGAAGAHADWPVLLDTLRGQIEQQLQLGTVGALDPYGLESPEELFAVSCEAFFITPYRLKAFHADVYRALSALFRHDPVSTGRSPQAAFPATASNPSG